MKKKIPMKNALIAVKSSGSTFATKDLFMTIDAPEIKAVRRISPVPITSCFFFIVLRGEETFL